MKRQNQKVPSELKQFHYQRHIPSNGDNHLSSTTIKLNQKPYFLSLWVNQTPYLFLGFATRRSFLLLGGSSLASLLVFLWWLETKYESRYSVKRQKGVRIHATYHSMFPLRPSLQKTDGTFQTNSSSKQCYSSGHYINFQAFARQNSWAPKSTSLTQSSLAPIFCTVFLQIVLKINVV